MDTKLAKSLGKEIRKRRESQGISQIDLSLDAGYSKSYVGIIERGEKSPTIDALFIICQTLDVTTSDVIKDVEKTMKKL